MNAWDCLNIGCELKRNKRNLTVIIFLLLGFSLQIIPYSLGGLLGISDEWQNRWYYLILSLVKVYGMYLILTHIRISIMVFAISLILWSWWLSDLVYEFFSMFRDQRLSISDGKTSTYFLIAILITMSLLFKIRKKFQIKHIKSVPYDPDKVLLAVRPPKRFIEYIGAIFNLRPIGSYKIVFGDNAYGFTKKNKKLTINRFTPSSNYNYLESKCTSDQLFDKFQELEGRSYHPIKFNCYHLKKLLS